MVFGELNDDLVVLVDQGDGWFAGLPKAVLARVEEITPTDGAGGRPMWRVRARLRLDDTYASASRSEATVILTLDEVRLGVFFGNLALAPSIPSLIEGAFPASEVVESATASVGKVTIFPRSHFGSLSQLIGQDPMMSPREEVKSIEFEVEVPVDAPWSVAAGGNQLRVMIQSFVPVAFPGLGALFMVGQLDSEIEWSLVGMPMVNEQSVAYRTHSVLVCSETGTVGHEGQFPESRSVLIVPVHEFRDPASLGIGAMFPVVKARVLGM